MFGRRACLHEIFQSEGKSCLSKVKVLKLKISMQRDLKMPIYKFALIIAFYIKSHQQALMNDTPASDLNPTVPGGGAVDDMSTLNQMNPDDLLVHLVKVQSVLCNKVGQLQQYDKIQTLIDARASFDAKIAELSSTPIVESFGFKHLATEAETLSTHIEPEDLVNKYYVKHPYQASHIGKFSLEERATLLTKYLKDRGLRSLGKKCLYELRRKIACDRPRAGGRFIRQKDKDSAVPLGDAQINTGRPNVPVPYMFNQTFPPSIGMFGGSMDQMASSRPNPAPITSFLEGNPSMPHSSTSPRYFQTQKLFSLTPHPDNSPDVYMGPSPYENLHLTTFNSNYWSTSASMPTNIFSTTNTHQLPALPPAPPSDIKCCCHLDMNNYLECPIHGLLSPVSGCPPHFNPPPAPAPQTASNILQQQQQQLSGSYLPNPVDLPTAHQSNPSKIAEYASCLQVSNISLLASEPPQAHKDISATGAESEAIPDVGSLANRGVLNEETLSVHISDNDEECLILGIAKKPTEQPKVAVPNVQTISELTSSYSTYNSDLDDKRRSKRGIRSRLASRPDSELSDVSFNSAIFAD